MNGFRVLIVAVVVLIGTSLCPRAAASDSEPWLEKLAGLPDAGPFSLDFEASVDLTGFGQPMKAEVTGSFLQQDRNHNVLELAVDLASMPGADGQPAMTIKGIADGTSIWSELRMFGVVSQVSRMPLDAEAPPIGVGANPLSFDPFRQLRTFSEMMDFEVVSLEKGRVTLRGAWKEDVENEELRSAGVHGFELVLDRASGFPISLKGLPEPSFLELAFGEVQRLAGEEFSIDTFRYTPPEGVPVIDQTSGRENATGDE